MQIDIVLRVVALLIAGNNLVCTFFAYMFRMEGASELESCLYLDVRIGFWFAFAFLLLRSPTPHGATWRRHLVSAIGATTIWILVTGDLCRTHLEQHSSRANEPIDEVIDEYLWTAIAR